MKLGAALIVLALVGAGCAEQQHPTSCLPAAAASSSGMKVGVMGGVPGGGFVPPTRILHGGGGGGTVTSISEGTGIVETPNPITSTGTIAADTTYLQRRVSGTCGTNSAIDQVNSDGTVGCQATGTGTLTGTGTIGDLMYWATSTSAGAYAGSSPTACSASQAMVSAALSAAGVLTTTCTGIVPSVSTTAPLSGGGSGALSLALNYTSNFRTSGSALDLNTAVTMPGSLTTKKTIGTPDAQTLASGAVTLTPGADATIERLTCDGVSGTQINTMAAGTDGQVLDIEDVSGFCEFNASGSSTTIETPNNQVVFLYGGANGDDGARAIYDSTLGKWAIISTAKITGVVAGTGLTNPTGNSSGIITLAANLAGASCAAGTAVTSISAAGAGSCSVFATGTGTVNTLPKWTSTSGALGNSAFADDGTTATLGTTNAEVKESTGEFDLNSAATPDHSQLQIRANSAGGLCVKNYGTDNVSVQFDECTVGGVNTAEYTTVGSITKIGGQIKIYGGAGQTVGSAVSVGERWHVDLGTGAMEAFGNTQLGSAATNTTTITGHLLGSTTTPSITSCGTSTLTAGSTDLDGSIVWDATATSCQLNFGTTYTNTAWCTLTYADTNAKGFIAQWIHSQAATNIVIYQSSASGSTVNYHCMGH